MMQNTLKPPLPKRLYVIGSNNVLAFETLPLYLNLVCEDGENPSGRILHILNPEMNVDASYERGIITRTDFKKACKEGRYLKLSIRERFSWEKRLVAVRPYDEPWYLEKELMQQVLKDRGLAALREADFLYKRDGDFHNAAIPLWYAIRAFRLSMDEVPLVHTSLIQAYLKQCDKTTDSKEIQDVIDS